MKKLLFLLFLLLYPQTAWATAQIPDQIIYQNIEYRLFGHPLDEHFKKYPDLKPKTGLGSTALWRGYIAKFKIKKQKFYLDDIFIETTDPKDTRFTKSCISQVFSQPEDRFLSWYSGLLTISYGKQTNFAEIPGFWGYLSSFENYYILEIQNGILTQERKYDAAGYEKFKKAQFAEFQKTDKYKELVKNLLKKNDGDHKFVDEFLYTNLTEYTPKFLVDPL